MLLYTFLYTLVLCISLFSGIYALSLSPTNKTHLLFFGVTICVSITCVLYVFSNSFDNLDNVWILYKFGITSYLIFFYLLYLFIENLTGFYMPVKIRILMFFLCLGSVGILILTDPIFDLIKYDHVWKLRAFRITPCLYLLNSFVLIIFILNIYILIKKYLTTDLNREKKQCIALLISVAFCFIPFFIIWNLMKYSDPDKYWLVAPMPFFFLFFLAGCTYCIINYRMFQLTPEFVSNDILSNINDSIILLDHRKTIITANSRTKSLLKTDKVQGIRLSDIIFEYQKIKKEIDKLFNKEINDFACRLHFRNGADEKIFMDIRFSIIKDKYSDALGVLLIGKEVKESIQLKKQFRITDREAELIQYLISGKSNMEISIELDISENTVKRHITNIYNKFGCGNRMQLLSSLKSFNIVPEQVSGRTIIVL